MSNPTAYFVPRPQTHRDLQQLHDLVREQPYVIEKTVVLKPIDYENFAEDLLADRPFLEELAPSGQRDVLSCILIRRQDSPDGILVVPTGDHVQQAAILP